LLVDPVAADLSSSISTSSLGAGATRHERALFSGFLFASWTSSLR
jgi:hypothetical protein